MGPATPVYREQGAGHIGLGGRGLGGGLGGGSDLDFMSIQHCFISVALLIIGMVTFIEIQMRI